MLYFGKIKASVEAMASMQAPPEIVLWRNVLLQMAVDASGGGVRSGDTRPEWTMEYAQKWFHTHHCREVCDLADVNYGYLMRKIDVSKRKTTCRNFSKGKRNGMEHKMVSR